MLINSFGEEVYGSGAYESEMCSARKKKLDKSAEKKAKGLIVDEVKVIYDKKLYDSINVKSEDGITSIKNELQINNLHDRINDLESINVNPVDLQGISATILTIFIPVALYLKDIIKFLSEVL